jgi:hypothetical protein
MAKLELSVKSFRFIWRIVLAAVELPPRVPHGMLLREAANIFFHSQSANYHQFTDINKGAILSC